MNNFFSKLSQPVLVTLCLVGGVLLIVLMDPPHNICTSQMEVFREDIGQYLFVDKAKGQKLGGMPRSGFQKDIQYCRNSNSTGGCYEFFFNFRDILRSFRLVSNECKRGIGQVKELKDAFWETIELMVRIAWGDKPPRGIGEKYGWMDASDMSLFCNIKRINQKLYSEKQWVDFRERMMKELPGSQKLLREQVWQLTILSNDCSQL